MTKTKLVCGVGINDADYNVCRREVVGGKYKIVWACPFYLTWKEMLRRCYDPLLHKRQPTYSECSVCNEWIYFSKFKAWMENQDWQGKELDKDILVSDNKFYSPETCVFVLSKVNLFLSEKFKSIDHLPTGVWLEKNSKYRATGNGETLGRYNTPEQAHQVWLDFKIQQAYILAAEQTDERVAKALINRYENYQINLNREN
jgi:hypothetical protein